MEMVSKDTAPKATIDFQAWDLAWYSVHLVLQGETLIVKYIDFPDSYNNTFSPNDFKTPKDVDDFLIRFRPASVQLQDNECYKVVQGMVVCASCAFGDDDVRFYDAVVVDVKRNDHKFLEGDCCTCAFVLFWPRGPNEGKETDAIVAHICLQQPQNGQTHPTLSRFLDICKKKLEAASQKIGGGSLKCSIPTNQNGAIAEYKGSSTHHFLEELDGYKHSDSSTIQKSKPRSTDQTERAGQIREHGTKTDQEDPKERSSVHFMFIENLEKDTSPLAIVEFVMKHVAVNSRALVFPASSESSYTRGVIVLESEYDFLKVSNFLQNPAHMILSSKGRPWVVTETKMGCVAFGAENVNVKALSEGFKNDGGIRVVKRGSEEYKGGKKLMGLFLEFAEHQQGLHKRFAFEESKMLRM